MHTYIHTYIRKYVRTYIHTYIHTYIQYIHTDIHTYTCIHTLAYLHAYLPTYLPTYLLTYLLRRRIPAYFILPSLQGWSCEAGGMASIFEVHVICRWIGIPRIIHNTHTNALAGFRDRPEKVNGQDMRACMIYSHGTRTCTCAVEDVS